MFVITKQILTQEMYAKNIDQNCFLGQKDKKQSSDQKEQEDEDNERYNSCNKINQFHSSMKIMMSPMSRYIFEPKDFSTPIEIAQFSEQKRCRNYQIQQQSSPLMLIQISGDIPKIAQRQHQQSDDEKIQSYQDECPQEDQQRVILDTMGNKICQFNIGYNNFVQASDDQLSPIFEDKENQKSVKNHNLQTPLKVRHHDTRSPLQDITPSMTHKKGKQDTKTNKKNKTTNRTANKGLQMEKWGLLTPRTMAQSRLNKGKPFNLINSKLKIERF